VVNEIHIAIEHHQMFKTTIMQHKWAKVYRQVHGFNDDGH
jgi:hypothetical protein